jgi:DNA polymerase elongation subunit (family B)
MRDEFKPTLYVNSKQKSDWKSLYGVDLSPIVFSDMKDATDFVKQYDDVAGFEVHGMTDYQYQYINENFNGDIEYDIDKMKIVFLDIEVISDEGFPDVQSASSPVVLIAVNDKASNKTIVFGFKSHTKSKGNYEYRIYKDEATMLRAFIEYWQQNCPDIVSGWNSDQFDFPYLINRITRLLDEDYAKRLSPFGMIKERMIEIRGKEVQTYEIVGITQLDYLDAYKKFGTYSAKESYALGFIANLELGESKHEIVGAKSFNDGYHSYYDEFVFYNALDAELVHRIDDKMKLLDLIISVSYLVKCNFRDVFGPVKTWDVFIYNHLAKKQIAVPPKTKKLTGDLEGAWVKDVIPGMYGWGMSFDAASLYPTIIRQWNLSPETLVKEHQEQIRVKNVVDCSGCLSQYAIDNNYTIAANGSMYRKDKKGIVPELMEFLMVGRKTAKKEMLKLEQEYQSTKNETLRPKISALNNRQMALKILANAGFGALSNAGFRYFDLRIGEAITLTGQACDKHLEKEINDYLNGILKTDNIDFVTAGDTDSLLINFQPLVDKLCPNESIEKTTRFLDKVGLKIQQTVIKKSIEHIYKLCNCFDFLMDYKREAIYSKAIWTARKRYALMVHNSEGVDYKPYKLKIMGLDIIKSSTPQTIRKLLKESLVVIFEQGELPLRKYVENCKSKIMKMTPDELAFPRGVSEIDKWFDGKTYKKGTPIHVRGSILFNLRIKDTKLIQFANEMSLDSIHNGDKVKFIYLLLPNPIKEDVISFPSNIELPEWFGLHKYIDYDTMFEKTFIAPLKGITDAIGFKLEEESSLEGFFG